MATKKTTTKKKAALPVESKAETAAEFGAYETDAHRMSK
jgi:hypothetical protein